MPGYKRKGYASVQSMRKRARRARRSVVTVPRGITGGTRVSYGSTVRSATADITVTQGTGSGYSMSFNSAGFTIAGSTVAWQGATDIANAFDAYRIKGVYIHFMFNQNQSAISVTTSTLPFLYIANDYDDATSLTFADIAQRDGAKQFLVCGDICKWKVVPKIAMAAYGTSAVTAYAEPKAMQWVSTGAIAGLTDAQHYGTKFYVDATKMTGSVTAIGTLRVYVQAYFDLKHAQ